MILRELSPLLMLIMTHILKGRIRPGHFKIPVIEKDLAKRWAGYWGEIALANYVKELPQDKYQILHDLQLQLNGIHFQIDTLLLSKSFILIIEVKNIIGKMGKMLLKHHSPTPVNILELYNLSERDIQSGVCCPKCLVIPMNYQRGKWLCSSCNTSSKDAHFEALNDYFYIIKPMIANSDFRHFLHIPTNDTAQKILRTLQLPTTGKTKDRLYHQPKRKVLPCVFLSKTSD